MLPGDAALLIRERFGSLVTLDAESTGHLIEELARLRIAGGAVYDALIAMTVLKAQGTLVTRDIRAAGTYRLLNADYELVLG